MGNVDGREDELRPERYADTDDSDRRDEHALLDAVLRETMGTANQAALDLIFDVARRSEYSNTAEIKAVEQVVQAIIKFKFGARKFSSRLINRIACTLIETPEATVKLERLWQEARASG
ncbi:MAG: hypothetical protein R3C53_17350 [Pirellulaceae bacterium]